MFLSNPRFSHGAQGRAGVWGLGGQVTIVNAAAHNLIPLDGGVSIDCGGGGQIGLPIYDFDPATGVLTTSPPDFGMDACPPGSGYVLHVYPDLNVPVTVVLQGMVNPSLRFTSPGRVSGQVTLVNNGPLFPEAVLNTPMTLLCQGGQAVDMPVAAFDSTTGVATFSSVPIIPHLCMAGETYTLVFSSISVPVYLEP